MKTIILGTAHLKSTPGKCSPDKKFYEYKYSREICQAIKAILKNMNYKVVIDIEDEDMKLTQSQELALRCKIVNDLCKKEDCIYISIHVNAAASDGKWHTGTGWEIYTSPGKTKADDLATCIYEAAKYNAKDKKMRTDFSDGDADKEAHLYVLKHTNCPAVLTENFFQDNKSDVEYLTSDKGFHEITRLHVEGILKYLEDN
jgi:N-acetylmuramoyl-L-alanine amidase